jgi:hypothetical protein
LLADALAATPTDVRAVTRDWRAAAPGKEAGRRGAPGLAGGPVPPGALQGQAPGARPYPARSGRHGE